MKQKQRAFTLIELLVVISIIGILIALGVTSYVTAQRKARDAKRKADLETVRQAMILYRQDNGSYGDVSSGFNTYVTALYPDYITSATVVDPKDEIVGEKTYQYQLSCDPVSQAVDCNRATLTVDLETEDETYVLVTP